MDPVVRRNVRLAPECKVKAESSLDLAPGFKVYRVAVRIAELAERVGVPTSTVRYYERVGLLDSPARTPSGYRDYDDEAAARLLFVSRARNMGLTCVQIADLLPIWDGTNCAGARERVATLISSKQAEIAERIAELESFSAQLDDVRAAIIKTQRAPLAADNPSRLFSHLACVPR